MRSLWAWFRRLFGTADSLVEAAGLEDREEFLATVAVTIDRMLMAALGRDEALVVGLRARVLETFSSLLGTVAELVVQLEQRVIVEQAAEDVAGSDVLSSSSGQDLFDCGPVGFDARRQTLIEYLHRTARPSPPPRQSAPMSPARRSAPVSSAHALLERLAGNDNGHHDSGFNSDPFWWQR